MYVMLPATTVMGKVEFPAATTMVSGRVPFEVMLYIIDDPAQVPFKYELIVTLELPPTARLPKSGYSVSMRSTAAKIQSEHRAEGGIISSDRRAVVFPPRTRVSR